MHYGDEGANCPAGARAASGAERLLALGFAQRVDDPELALRTLGEALAATPALPPPAQTIAYRSRAEATEIVAYRLAAGPERDRLLVEALADYRRVAAARPDDVETLASVGFMLQALGAYPEALEAYRAIGSGPARNAYVAAVEIGALQRQQGDYQAALATLDDFARGNPGEADGMRFRYHRARALTLLGRYDEALTELDRGLASQADYAYAHLLRACVRGRLGQLSEALADEERGMELLGLVQGGPRGELLRDFERSRSVVSTLRTAAASRRPQPTAVACEGFWDDSDRPRQRSALLDSASVRER